YLLPARNCDYKIQTFEIASWTCIRSWSGGVGSFIHAQYRNAPCRTFRDLWHDLYHHRGAAATQYSYAQGGSNWTHPRRTGRVTDFVFTNVRTAHPRICIVGNLIGRNAGKITTQGLILADLLRMDGYDVIAVSSRLNRALRMTEIILTIIWYRRSINVVIVEIYSGLSFVIADVTSRLGKWLGIKTVGVLHGGALPEFVSRHATWGSRVFHRFDRLAAPSVFLKRSFDGLGFNIRIIPNIIDLEAYPHKLRRRIEPRLIWMRAFHVIYNPELAVKAFALISKKYPEATLVMAGVDKGLGSRVKQLAKDLGVAEKVRFPGFLDAEGKTR